jgi:DME family drug/metabolite transporter
MASSTSPASRALAPRLQLLAAAALFSTGGAAIKAVHFSGWPVACLRSSIAAAALLLAVPQVRRRPSWRMLGVAACYAASMILFVQANKLTTAASTIYLQSTAPLFVLLLGPWLLGERFRRSDLLSMAAIALGLALLVTGLPAPSATAPQPLRGNLFAALSGFTWAATIMGLRALARTRTAAGGDQDGSSAGGGAAGGEGIVAAFWGNVLAAGTALPFSLPLPPSEATDWLVLAFLGIFQIGLAYVLMTRGIARVPALEASLLLLLEPVLNPLWAWLVHGEHAGPRVLAGGALILAATLLNSWHDARLAARERATARSAAEASGP